MICTARDDKLAQELLQRRTFSGEAEALYVVLLTSEISFKWPRRGAAEKMCAGIG